MNLHVDGCWGPPPPTHPGADNKAANLQGTLEVQWVRKSHAEQSFSGLLSYRHLSAGLIGPFDVRPSDVGQIIRSPRRRGRSAAAAGRARAQRRRGAEGRDQVDRTAD